MSKSYLMNKTRERFCNRADIFLVFLILNSNSPIPVYGADKQARQPQGLL
jgi:hypothetical protein